MHEKIVSSRPDKAFTPPSGNLLQAAGWRFAYPAYSVISFSAQ
ncbi:hypothetical protein P10159_0438 [Citrobacter portucalensis]|nr:hypothetical protein P10159_0438 [Citrobacter portucalensis]